MTKSDFFKLMDIDEAEYLNMTPTQKCDLVKSKANKRGELYSGEFFLGKTIESIKENNPFNGLEGDIKTIGGESIQQYYSDELSDGALFSHLENSSVFRKVDHFIAQSIFIDYFDKQVVKFKNGRSFERMGGLCWYNDYVLEEYLPAYNVTKEEFLTGTCLTEERIVKELENTSGFSFDFIARICMYLGLDIERESRFATNLRLEQYLHDIDGKFPNIEFVGTEWNNLFKPDSKE